MLSADPRDATVHVSSEVQCSRLKLAWLALRTHLFINLAQAACSGPDAGRLPRINLQVLDGHEQGFFLC